MGLWVRKVVVFQHGFMGKEGGSLPTWVYGQGRWWFSNMGLWVRKVVVFQHGFMGKEGGGFPTWVYG